MESSFEALVRGWVDVDGRGAPQGMRGIVRSCWKTLEPRLKAEGIRFTVEGSGGAAMPLYRVTFPNDAEERKAVTVARSLASAHEVTP